MARYEKKKGCKNKHYCPKCGEELSEVIRGHVPDSYVERLRKQGRKYHIGGCMCYGDERDAQFRCDKCDIKYTKDLIPLELMSCPLEASNAIIRGDCIDGELRTKRSFYRFLRNKDVSCKMICPNVGKEVEIKTKNNKIIKGKILRTFKTTVSCPGEHVLLIRELERYKYEYEDVPLVEIASVKEV